MGAILSFEKFDLSVPQLQTSFSQALTEGQDPTKCIAFLDSIWGVGSSDFGAAYFEIEFIDDLGTPTALINRQIPTGGDVTRTMPVSVVEIDAQSMQSGLLEVASINPATGVTVSISSVNRNNAFVTFTYSTDFDDTNPQYNNGTNDNDGTAPQLRVEFTSNTQITFFSGDDATANYRIRWTVTEDPDFEVQHFSGTLAGVDEEANLTLTAVKRSRTMLLIGQTVVDDGLFLSDAIEQAYLSSPTNLRLRRGATSGDEIRWSAQVVTSEMFNVVIKRIGAANDSGDFYKVPGINDIANAMLSTPQQPFFAIGFSSGSGLEERTFGGVTEVQFEYTSSLTDAYYMAVEFFSPPAVRLVPEALTASGEAVAEDATFTSEANTSSENVLWDADLVALAATFGSGFPTYNFNSSGALAGVGDVGSATLTPYGTLTQSGLGNTGSPQSGGYVAQSLGADGGIQIQLSDIMSNVEADLTGKTVVIYMQLGFVRGLSNQGYAYVGIEKSDGSDVVQYWGGDSNNQSGTAENGYVLVPPPGASKTVFSNSRFSGWVALVITNYDTGQIYDDLDYSSAESAFDDPVPATSNGTFPLSYAPHASGPTLDGAVLKMGAFNGILALNRIVVTTD